MTNITEKNDSKTIALIVAEVAVLLMLPLPFFKLNVLYVILALIITMSLKYIRKEKWSQYGFRPINRKLFLRAIAIGIIFGYVDNYFIENLIARIVGVVPDLSDYSGVKGNIGGLIGMLLLGWVVGGFFEEFFFRGYIFYRLSSIIKNPLAFKIIAIGLTSIVFAFAHNYQGACGIIDTGLFSIIMGLLYFLFGKNIWYLFIIHGLYDSVGIFKLYLS
jgi:membrane protease YdiL (CAAX protease family)